MIDLTAAQIACLKRIHPDRIWRNKYGQAIARVNWDSRPQASRTGYGYFAILQEGDPIHRGEISPEEEAVEFDWIAETATAPVQVLGADS